MFISLRRRSFFSFAIAFYLLHLALVCNIFFDIGATMGERLIYHSSLGFAMVMAWLIYKGFSRLQPRPIAQQGLVACMSVLIILAAWKTIPRNAEWKNDGTLFEADLKTVPNSVLVCANVAAAYITRADFQTTDTAKHEYLYKAVKLLDHALTIHPNMVASYINRGIAWYKLGNMDKAKANLDSAKVRYPTYPTLPGIYKLVAEDYMNKGWNEYGKKGLYPEAIEEFKKGIAIDSANADLWYNLGGAYYSNKQLPEAITAWKRSLAIRPGYVKAQQGLQAALIATGAVAPPPQPAHK
jgi:tetratricopeptide (TPR) repeat protein